MKFDFVINIDPGRHVVCDLCNEDWTDSPVSGGFIFGSYGVCPKCAPKFEKDVIECGEERYIRQRCPPHMSHADWIRDVVR